MRRFERSFQIWEYWVSHAQLLVRSPSDVSHPRNLDLIFVGVQYVELPVFLPGLELVEALPEEEQRAAQAVGEAVPLQHVFVLVTRGIRYLVVAGAMEILENDLPFMKSSLVRSNS